MQRTLLVLALFCSSAGLASAQFPARPGSGGGFGTSGSGGFGSSTPGAGLSGGIGTAPSASFSPYLSLFSGRGTTAANLYGIVRPQQNLQQGLQMLQQSYIAGSGQDDATTMGAVIGTKARFLNTGGYFLNLAGGTTPMAGGGGGSFSGPRSGAGGGLSNFGALPSSAGLSLPQQGALGGSGTGSFGSPTPKGGGRPSGPAKN